MADTGFTNQYLEQEGGAVEAQLRDLLPTDETENELKLTGLEILGFLAAKIVVSIACSFVGRVIYDKYKNMQVNAQADQARKELEGAVAEEEAVEENTVIHDLTTVLKHEGVAEQVARQTVTDTYRRMKQRCAARTEN